MHPHTSETGFERPPGADVSMPEGEALLPRFFERSSAEVAVDLVGKIVWRVGFGGGRLTEVEAYLPVGDAASHSACGPTVRNAAMFGGAGRLYVFLSYGVHRLLNFVCDEEGAGSAVLVRSFAPLASGAGGDQPRGARGPGVVGRTLGISLDMSGQKIGPESGLYVLDDGARPRIGRGPRIGISRAVELPLRHYMVDSAYVSGARHMKERV